MLNAVQQVSGWNIHKHTGIVRQPIICGFFFSDLQAAVKFHILRCFRAKSQLEYYRDVWGYQSRNILPRDLFPLMGNLGRTEQEPNIPKNTNRLQWVREDRNGYAIREIKLCPTLRGCLGINFPGLQFVNHNSRE